MEGTGLNNHLIFHRLARKHHILFSGILIIGLVVGASFVFLTERPLIEDDAVSLKVSMIMSIYRCDDHRIYRAIMETFDPVLVATVIAVESGYRVDAVSPAGARGLMQLTPDKLKNWKDVKKNICVGAAYLKEQIERFQDLDLAIAAYNAGPSMVLKYRGVPPFKETVRYVRKARLFSLALGVLLSGNKV